MGCHAHVSVCEPSMVDTRDSAEPSDHCPAANNRHVHSNTCVTRKTTVTYLESRCLVCLDRSVIDGTEEQWSTEALAEPQTEAEGGTGDGTRDESGSPDHTLSRGI